MTTTSGTGSQRVLGQWMRVEYDRERFGYQSCRFCKVSILDAGALWKYGVRHYACDACLPKTGCMPAPEEG